MTLFDVARYIGGLMATLALMGVALLLARRFLPHMATPLRPQERRLRLVESLSIDQRRRVVLIRCDENEHLLLLGSTNERVISAGAAAADNAPDHDDERAP